MRRRPARRSARPHIGEQLRPVQLEEVRRQADVGGVLLQEVKQPVRQLHVAVADHRGRDHGARPATHAAELRQRLALARPAAQGRRGRRLRRRGSQSGQRLPIRAAAACRGRLNKRQRPPSASPSTAPSQHRRRPAEWMEPGRPIPIVAPPRWLQKRLNFPAPGNCRSRPQTGSRRNVCSREQPSSSRRRRTVTSASNPPSGSGRGRAARPPPTPCAEVASPVPSSRETPPDRPGARSRSGGSGSPAAAEPTAP
jgi:hypothetical protein